MYYTTILYNIMYSLRSRSFRNYNHINADHNDNIIMPTRLHNDNALMENIQYNWALKFKV